MGLFNDGVAFVTGAGSGIGRACVMEFINEGVTKVIGADLSSTYLEQTAAAIKSTNPNVRFLTVVGDVSKDADVQRMVADGVKEFGRIDYAVNSAGIVGRPNTSADQSVEDFDRVINVNGRGVWLSERAELIQMRSQEPRTLKNGIEARGSIVNISSIYGLVGAQKLPHYIYAKHAVAGVTKADAIDHAELGIRVNAVCPGFVRTGLVTDEQWETLQPLVQSCPMHRAGFVEEVAAAVAFLASDKASFITGTTLAVDGGYTCH